MSPQRSPNSSSTGESRKKHCLVLNCVTAVSLITVSVCPTPRLLKIQKYSVTAAQNNNQLFGTLSSPRHLVRFTMSCKFPWRTVFPEGSSLVLHLVLFLCFCTVQLRDRLNTVWRSIAQQSTLPQYFS